MPQKKSAAKAHRKSLKEYARNSSIRKMIKDLRKKADRAAQRKATDEAVKYYRQLQKAVDKASKSKGFLSRNTAARIKSRLHKRINALKNAK